MLLSSLEVYQKQKSGVDPNGAIGMGMKIHEKFVEKFEIIII